MQLIPKRVIIKTKSVLMPGSHQISEPPDIHFCLWKALQTVVVDLMELLILDSALCGFVGANWLLRRGFSQY